MRKKADEEGGKEGCNWRGWRWRGMICASRAGVLRGCSSAGLEIKLGSSIRKGKSGVGPSGTGCFDVLGSFPWSLRELLLHV